MDSIGKPGTPHVDGAVVLVALVLVVLVVLVVVDVEVEVTTTVDVEVVVPGMTSGIPGPRGRNRSDQTQRS